MQRVVTKWWTYKFDVYTKSVRGFCGFLNRHVKIWQLQNNFPQSSVLLLKVFGKTIETIDNQLGQMYWELNPNWYSLEAILHLLKAKDILYFVVRNSTCNIYCYEKESFIVSLSINANISTSVSDHRSRT